MVKLDCGITHISCIDNQIVQDTSFNSSQRNVFNSNHLAIVNINIQVALLYAQEEIIDRSLDYINSKQYFGKILLTKSNILTLISRIEKDST